MPQTLDQLLRHADTARAARRTATPGLAALIRHRLARRRTVRNTAAVIALLLICISVLIHFIAPTTPEVVSCSPLPSGEGRVTASASDVNNDLSNDLHIQLHELTAQKLIARQTAPRISKPPL